MRCKHSKRGNSIKAFICGGFSELNKARNELGKKLLSAISVGVVKPSIGQFFEMLEYSYINRNWHNNAKRY